MTSASYCARRLYSRAASAATLSTLGNTHAIAVNQDALGTQGRLLAEAEGAWQLWGGPLAGGCVAALLINLVGVPRLLAVSWAQLGIAAARPMDAFELGDAARRVAAGAVGAVNMSAQGGNDCAFYRLCPAS